MNSSSHHIQQNCLNCSRELNGNYCQNCGQKASTHRYSFKHFLEHDFIHGVWHVDKGLLYTLKELLTRPGHSVREFIQGKRVRFFSFVTLIILILAIASLLTPFTQIRLTDLMPERARESMNAFEAFNIKYPKVIVLIMIPLYSLFTFLWFKRAKLNYSEHLVLNSYKTAVELLLSLAFTVITVFYTHITTLFTIYSVLVVIGGFIYGIWFYSQFFIGYAYSRSSVIIRAILVPVSYLMLSMLIGVVMGVLETLK